MLLQRRHVERRVCAVAVHPLTGSRSLANQAVTHKAPTRFAIGDGDLSHWLVPRITDVVPPPTYDPHAEVREHMLQ